MAHDQQQNEQDELEVSTEETPGDRESRPGGTAQLVVVHSLSATRVGERFDLGDDLTLIGREIDGPGLCIDDRHMSRLHARCVYDSRAGMHRLADAGSRNGTFVNGRPIETVLLSDGDVVRVGESVLVYSQIDAMERVTLRADAIARSDLHLLICGETGTGKEVLARRIHRESRRTGELIAINCASLPPDLVAAELFGHTKQAFSGAATARQGLFMAANQGTLLLDEIGDCPLDTQAALLRAIQEKRIRSVGADREVPVDVRIVAATNVNLEEAVTQRRFRADLYARLSQTRLELPPLRARRTDILTLVQELVPPLTATLQLSADAAEAMLLWHWPMNVRELQAVVRAHIALRGASILDLPALARHGTAIASPIYERRRNRTTPPRGTLPPAEFSERAKLRALLEAHGGNVSAVADALGKPRAQIYRWMRSMGLAPEKYRS